MRQAFILALMLAACDSTPSPPDNTPGGRLEAAAIARGLVADPAKAGLTGVWASDTDRLCVVPDGKGLRIGASVDYGEGQACAASGNVDRNGDRLKFTLGDCKFDARFDGERIVLPAELPQACARACSGRASLTALAVERLSESVSEAASLRGPNGKLLCGGS